MQKEILAGELEVTTHPGFFATSRSVTHLLREIRQLKPDQLNENAPETVDYLGFF